MKMPANSNKKNTEKINTNLSELEIKERGYVPVSGYLILFDIVDSTSRKEEYSSPDNNWLKHLNMFYKDFCDFSYELVDKVANKVETMNNKKINFIKKKKILKTAGDVGFLFLPFENQKVAYKNKKANPTIAKLILEEVIRFINYPSAIPDLKLKTVVTYLYEVYLVAPISGETKSNYEMDIVGKGVDFSFRLEQFANSSCCLLNKYFFQSIDKKEIMVDKKTYNFFKVKKNIRNWKEEEFYFLTNETMIENAFDKSGDRNSIYIEVFAKYIQYKKTKTHSLA